MYVAARRLQFQRRIRQTAIILEPVLTEEHRLLMLLRTMRLSDWEYDVLFIDSLNKNIFTIWKIRNNILNMQLLLNREKLLWKMSGW